MHGMGPIPRKGVTPLQIFSVCPVFSAVRRGAQSLTPTTIMKIFTFSIGNAKVVPNGVNLVSSRA